MGMIDIGEKKAVKRTATASGMIHLKRSTIDMVRKKEIKKGDVLQVAQIAAMMAAKKTPDLIPHCHQIPIESVDVDFELSEESIKAVCTVKTTAKTGVEMEALLGVTNALNTIWDMVKYLEKDDSGQYPKTRIAEIKVDKKTKAQV